MTSEERSQHEGGGGGGGGGEGEGERGEAAESVRKMEKGNARV